MLSLNRIYSRSTPRLVESKNPMSAIRHSLLLLLLLSQATFMAAGGSLVLCSEVGSRSQFEFLSGECCEAQELGYTDDSELESGNQRMELGDKSDCGDCEDRGFALAALERHRCPVPAPRLASNLWNAPCCFERGPQAGVTRIGVTHCTVMGRDPGGEHGLLGRGLLDSVVLRC